MTAQEGLKVYDGRVHHPFTCIVAGPSGSGKSTFVRSLMLSQEDRIDVKFDYICIVLGTEAAANPTLNDLKQRWPERVQVVEAKNSYPSEKAFREKFPCHLKKLLDERSEGGKKKGCIIFDDLMHELAECDLMVNLFTKFSSHYNLTVIYITQNLFFKAGGKHGSDNVTLYRNTHMLVVFKSPMDNSVLRTLAHRLQPGASKPLASMMANVLEGYRYLVVCGKFDRPNDLRYVTDFFATDPIPHQKVFLMEQASE